MVRGLIHTAIFLVGLLGAAAAIRHFDDLPFWDFCRHKVTHLSRELASYDTLFVGSSRFHSSIIPAEFDARMAALGLESHSFNLGLRGLRMHDFQVLLDWVVAQKPRQLKRVIIELYTYDQYLRDGSWMTGVQVEVHSPQVLMSRLASNAMSHHDFVERMDINTFILAHTTVNMFRIGQAGRIVRDVVRRSVGAKLSPGAEIAAEGFEELSVEAAPKNRVRQHREWQSDLAGATKMLEARKQNLCPDWMKGGFNLEAFRRQVVQLEAAGIEVAYVVMPQLSYGFYGRDGVVDAKKLATVIEIDSPNDNADLYQFDLWFDSNHLLKQGAELVSRRVAEKYAAARAATTRPR